MKTLQSIIQFLIFFTLFVISVIGNTVSYDTSFNGTGYSINTVGDENAYGDSLAIQSDGKLIIGGWTTVAISNDDEIRKFALIRLNTDGTLDTSFGINGTATASIDGSIWGTKILIQPDGKILLATTYTSDQFESFNDFVLLRFTSDGQPDTSFNSKGFTRVDINSVSLDICLGMTLQADGKIVLVGRTWSFDDQQFDIAAVRINSDGSLDTTFDGDGILKINSPDFDEQAHAVLVQADGKILIGGVQITNTRRFLITRLNANGTTDSSFGTNGTLIYFAGNFTNNINSLALQSDGNILASGSGKIARISPNGVRDMSFGDNGLATAFTSNGAIGETNKIIVLDDDKFVIGLRYGVIRFMANGAIDTHIGGIFIPPGNSCYMNDVSIQSDGKFVIGGNCRNLNDGLDRFTAIRLQENRTKRYLDFNGNEKTDISIYRPSNGQWWFLEYLFTQRVAGQLGTPTDLPVPADFTGDGRADLAIFRPSSGEWFVIRSDGGSFYSFPFGTSGDIPTPADYDGDNIADPAVFRPSNGAWYIEKSTGGTIITTFGLPGDIPVASDYDGDFKTDIAIYRPSTGVWWIQKSSDESVYAFQFGTSTDKPVPGDFTGDNKTDAAFWRASTGEWFVLRSEDYSYYSFPFGLSDDLPVVGDYSNDERFDIAVFRPSTNRWHILPTGGEYFYKDFGADGDTPLANTSVP